MSNHTSTNDHRTPRSSHLSQSVAPSPVWAPPRAPLSPHRLAKLANALGVSTPVPPAHHNTSYMSRSLLDTLSPLDTLRRSPTPSSAASMASYSPMISKYLLHIIPPLHLPHDSEEDSDVTPPPGSASGYHTQFFRGTLVPVYSTLQAQLAAIAKEYALPSTTGLILYLVSSAKVPSQQTSTPHTGLEDDGGDEPGPRLSEEIWKFLWTRVTKAEQRDDYLLPSSRSPTPNIFTLSNGAQSTPSLPQDGQPLRPFISTMGPDSAHPQPLQSPFSPSPSTPSTTSDTRSHTKYAPPSSSSVSQSDPETPDTSTGSHSFLQDPVTRQDSLDLPGLNSPSVIPILAKVEFDIDRRKAAWYDPWLRSRRMNHVKRTEGRGTPKYSVNEDEGIQGEKPEEKYPPITLVTGNKEASSIVLSKGAALLQQSTPIPAVHDPFPQHQDNDEFSEDDETNSNVVPLAMDDLSVLPNSPVSEYEHLGKEEDELHNLLDQMSRPQLPFTNPPSPPSKRSSSPSSSRRHLPPPLVIKPNTGTRDLVVPTESSPMPSSAGSTHLAYLSGELSAGGSGERTAVEDDVYVTYTGVRSTEENKRDGAVFDDLDLGLDPSEDFDDGDPNDRRRSQFVMKAQLDEIERTMAQLSPRILQTDFAEEQNRHLPVTPAPKSVSLSPGKWSEGSSPRLPRQPEVTDDSNRDSSEVKGQAAWPAVPFASLNDSPVNMPPSRPDGPPSPPRLAVNGITTSAPTSFVASSRLSLSEMSAETQMRKRALEEEQGYLASRPSGAAESPIIPLSPDPFGRFSSTPSGRSSAYWESESPVPAVQPSSSLSSITEDAHSRARSNSSATTSRFSADSIALEETTTKPAARSTLMTVNTIKRLWRKSSKNAPTPSAPPPPPPPTPITAGRPSTQTPQRPERPSQEEMDLPPTTPTKDRFSPQLFPPPRSQDLPPSPQPPQMSVPLPHLQAQQLPLRPSPQQPPVPLPQQPPVPHLQQLGVTPSQQRLMPYSGRPGHAAPILAAQMQPSRGSASTDRLLFDQESPYPIRRMPPQSPQPTSPPTLSSPIQQSSDLPRANTPPLPIPPVNVPPLEKEKPVARKSILKGWRSATPSTPSPPPMPELQPSTDWSSTERANASNAARGKRSGTPNFGSSRSSVVSPPPDIPPSPQIPQQYIIRNEHRQSVKSRLASGSVDLSGSNSPSQNGALSTSPQRSMSSSVSSRPSFDASQFEMVSPRVNSTLS